MTFSLLVGLKNNLVYTQYFYTQTRLLYPNIELVFVSFNSTDGTHQWLDSLQDKRVRYYYEERDRTLSDTYNKCIELATSDYVVFAHNDMVLAPGFIEQLTALQTDEQVLFYTTVEPPIFADDPRPGKIVRDFGADVAMFQRDAFFQFAQAEQQRNEQASQTAVTTSKGIFFLSASRNLLLDIGGLDPLFNPMFCEDDDLLLRFGLKGVEMVVGLNVLCYHFVSKTSRFSEEYVNRTRQIELQSNRNFVRKWGFRNSDHSKHKYDIGLILTNGTVAALWELEPWVSTIYTDLDPAAYILEEQPTTAVDLTKKIKPLTAERNSGVLVSIDAGKAPLDQITFLSEIIYNRINKPKSALKKFWYRLFPAFTWRGYRIRIIDPTTHETRLIHKKLTYA
ncbi:glycosyltransferase family 2 protein [Spirosoma sp. KUDC1026]|uniref:glycosyltransferase family 2 protein n=1 Tax=Spirosoma sp. KUDC1026 TaxID=2745947 RepID=UPI00159BDB91|nr:glycosyltransferase [Spirosoma sp. KUDC1026]QKZ14831.1 glycosyltransferase [Spirosoma sp. KUDC1026]